LRLGKELESFGQHAASLVTTVLISSTPNDEPSV